jgi:hypothetical protein
VIRPRELPADTRVGREGSAIEVRGLVMRYGDREVLHGIDLVVPHGMVVGFLGPNGAGKTTTVEILEGYRRRTGGRASVLGMDPATGGRELRERIGIVLQETGHNPELTVRETVRQFAGYYRRPRPVEEVVGWSGWARRPTGGSGPSREGSAGAWTWGWPWSATPSWSSWTSRPPASTRPPAARPGR